MSSTKEQRLRSLQTRVLLVDDDDDVRETSADMLEELGYEVVRAANAFEALGKLEAHPSVAVMVTDVRMPGMSGLELLEIAGQRYRQLKVILMSGYFTPQPFKCRFLQKPFRTADLDAAIQAELATGQ